MEPGAGAMRPLWPRPGQTPDSETRRTVWCLHPWPARQAVVVEGAPLVVCVSCGVSGAVVPGAPARVGQPRSGVG